MRCHFFKFDVVIAAFEKLGLDCASWNEPVYSDLLRCFYFIFGYLLHCYLAYACVLNSNGEIDCSIRFHEIMLINALNFIEALFGKDLAFVK